MADYEKDQEHARIIMECAGMLNAVVRDAVAAGLQVDLNAYPEVIPPTIGQDPRDYTRVEAYRVDVAIYRPIPTPKESDK